MSQHHDTQGWLISSSTKKVFGNFDERDACLITKVAKNSPAAQIDLSAGDYVVLIDGVAALNVDILETLVASRANIAYQFYSATNHQLINITASRIPLGFIAEPSSHGIVERCRKEGFCGWSDLVQLWERRNWNQLLESSDLVADNDVVTRLLQKLSKDYGKSAEILFRGAALYELGDEETGIKHISWFIDNDSQNHESYMHAIAYFYASKWCELTGDENGNKQWLFQANRSNRGKLERIAQHVYLKQHELPSTKTHWLGNNFPIRYHLSTIDDPERKISLDEVLKGMGTDELQPVCVMPSYRGNGPYNESMLCYRSVYRFFSHRLRPLHVITDVLQKRVDKDWWYENEEAALEAGIPIILLDDTDRVVADSLDNSFTPIFYLLNNKGMIEYEGGLNQPYDYWEALGQIPEQRQVA